MKALPIDASLPVIVDGIRKHGALVLVAETGAGKTTRLPRALLDASFAREGRILVLEPRRLAARLAARFVASEMGEAVGETVGYQVRFDRKIGPHTRLEFMTEGVLLRRLIGDPYLRGVSAVLIDEFHERHLETDLALALLAGVRRSRPDLALVVMSASMDPEPVSRFIGGPVVTVPGRTFPIDIVHDSTRDGRSLELRVRHALGRVAAEGSTGGVLVFLPGVREIRRAHREAETWARATGVRLFDLYGEMSRTAQDRVMDDISTSKVIFATNVAETSLTIEGIDTVIDSGWVREAGTSPWSGLPTLETVRISKHSALQRAGRAGRLGPGRCFRLYPREDLEHAPESTTPEIRRLDLSQVVLQIAAMGLRADDLEWFEAPPRVSLEAAFTLLERLGALDANGSVTARGRRMAGLPLHPRQATLAIEADERGERRRGALLAVLLGERGITAGVRSEGRVRSTVHGSSDLLARAEAFERFEALADRKAPPGRSEMDAGSYQRIARARDQVLRELGPAASTADANDEKALLISTLRAYPDRVARRRKARAPFLQLARGEAVRLSSTSIVQQAEILVALDAVQREGRETIVHTASAVEGEWLFDLYPERIEHRRALRFDDASESVISESSLVYDGIAIETSIRRDCRDEETGSCLAKEILSRGLDSVCSSQALARWKERLAFAHSLDEEIPRWEDLDLSSCMETLCHGLRALDEVRRLDVLGALKAMISSKQAAQVERLAPDRITLASGKSLRVEYRRGKAPSVASYLQDFFGMHSVPAVGGGRVSLVLEMMAPNRRPVQVTRDLAGFWERHYPALRRSLARRYSRHAWPEDPATAKPQLLARRDAKKRGD